MYHSPSAADHGGSAYKGDAAPVVGRGSVPGVNTKGVLLGGL